MHNLNIICIITLKNYNFEYKEYYKNKSNAIASCSNDKTIKIWEETL